MRRLLVCVLLALGVLGCAVEPPREPIPTGCQADTECNNADDCKIGTCQVVDHKGTCTYGALNGGLCELVDVPSITGGTGVCIYGQCEDRYCEVADDCEKRPCGVAACYLNTCTWKPQNAGLNCVWDDRPGVCNDTGQCE